MLSCSDDAACDERANPQSQTCGSSTWAIAYFCTFIFLCMFFVSIYSQFQPLKNALKVVKLRIGLLCALNYFFLGFLDAQSVRGRYYG